MFIKGILSFYAAASPTLAAASPYPESFGSCTTLPTSEDSSLQSGFRLEVHDLRSHVHEDECHFSHRDRFELERTGLWCIFELAAFREANPGYCCSVLPLFLFGAEIWCWIWGLSTCFGVLWLAGSGRTSVGNPLFVGIFVGGVFLPTCLLVYFCRTKYREKHQLLEDLQFFEFEKVSCKTEFDRSFIFQAINQWYGSQEAFVNLVRGPIRDELLNMLPSPHIPVGHVMFISTSTTSLLIEGIAALHLAGKFDYDAAIAILAWASHILFALPIGFNLLFYVSDQLASGCSFVTSLAKSLAGAGIASAWVAFSIGMATVSSWLGIIWLSIACFAFHLLLFYWVFRPSLQPAKDEVISI